MININSLRHHPEFDMVAARKLYAASEAKNPLDGQMVTSPYHLYSVEELRDRLELRLGQPFPTDVFVFCKGEPMKPDWTKVGGMPYWTDDRKWPVDQTGKPLRFVAQFNFLDSKDLVGTLPGDVLLIFASRSKSWLYEPLYFEWLSTGSSSIPITDPNRLLYPKSVFHGAIYRTADFPDAREKLDASDLRQPYNLPILNGTKIAGRPHLIQGDDDLEASPETGRENPFRPGEMIVVPARPSRKGYLCQLGSIQASALIAYPWANLEKSIELYGKKGSISSEDNSIVFEDMGSFYIYRSETGALWNEFAGY